MKTPILQKLLWLTRGMLCIFLVQVLSISLLLAATGKSQDVLSVKEMRVSLRLNNEDILQAFKKIESLSSFTFEYNASDLRNTERVSGRYNNQTLYDVLVDLSRQTGIKFKQVGNNIAAAPKNEKEVQQEEVEIIPQISVTGKVTDQENGDALPGANVVEKGTSNGTVTDIDGNYSVNVDENATLVFSSIGYATQEIPVNGRSTIDIEMPSDVQSLEEIVVIGYGTQERKDVTGSIATVDQKDFEAQPVTRFDQILQGRTPGVNVTNTSGAPGGAVSIRIRGANSINGSNEPLYVVDGFVGANFRDVNPSDIESIQVLKDASATAIYGSRGANGVVLITTKSGKAGEPKLSVTARFNTSQILDTWDLMDAATFAETANQRATALGTSLPFTDAEISDFRQNGGTDWQNELLEPASGRSTR